MRIAIITQRKDSLAAFSAGLAAQGAQTDWLSTPKQAIDQARIYPRNMVILDDQTGDFRAILSDLMEANALLHTAVITPMDAESFHEASEGLGVLSSLPPSPNAEHAHYLMDKLKEVLGG
ncbi:MAG: response regulator receiver protein [Holophagaceae bacterium]|nr:response regulator receiver protein [Holophagaceae bacterium]